MRDKDEWPERELYDEYVGELDKVPVLTDLVAITRRILPPDFRAGQRPDVRREPRPDPVSVREAAAEDAATLYLEYVCADGTADAPAKRGKRDGAARAAGVAARASKGAAAKRSGKRKGKRVKRSARSRQS